MPSARSRVTASTQAWRPMLLGDARTPDIRLTTRFRPVGARLQARTAVVGLLSRTDLPLLSCQTNTGSHRGGRAASIDSGSMEPSTPPVIVLADDLIWASRLRAAVEKAGFSAAAV